MSGETHLSTLIASMRPVLLDESYVFACLNQSQLPLLDRLQCKGTFLEEEGTTVIISKQQAIQFDIFYDCVFRCITLTVHSSLQAVGLTAAFANQLKQAGISANVVAGFYHDHIFVPEADARLALAALLQLAQQEAAKLV